MALIKTESIDTLADELIQGAEDEKIGFFTSFYGIIKRLALGTIIKGFMAGIGIFLGSLFCHYYILPHLNLQYYSLFLIKLHRIK